MSFLRVTAQAPSNIALAKYMGKKDSVLNLPENPSLSMTLNSLATWAEVRILPSGGRAAEKKIQWLPEAPSKAKPQKGLALEVPILSEASIRRIIRHVDRLKQAVPALFSAFEIDYDRDKIEQSSMEVRTASSFPTSSGIASSASSYAAITLAIVAGFASNPDQLKRIFERDDQFKRQLAGLSRAGSGSSCRSFEGPWVLWDHEGAGAILAEGMPPMAHFVLLVRTGPKEISSSEAHQLVRTSPLWEGRTDRVESRIRSLIAALGEADLLTLAQMAWAETWEMHSLFHTCAEPFSYWDPGTLEVLQWFRTYFFARTKDRKHSSDMPIVTLDAGPNVHIIVPESKREEWRKILSEQFGKFRKLEDEQGRGAGLVDVATI